MKITREAHGQYMGVLAPILLVGYLAQVWCYYHLIGPGIAYDISIFLGIGIILIALAFLIHDNCYQATLHDNHLTLELIPFPVKDEILFCDIEKVEVFPTRFNFSHLKITTDEGKGIWIYNVDNASHYAEQMKSRRYR